MSKSVALSVASGLLLLSSVPAAENWPQWRGPQSQGVSSETGLPVQWSLQKNLAWKAPLAGAGVSSPVVWGDRVIVTSQTGRAHGARGSFPLLARDDSTLAEREHPIQGARPAPASESGDVFLVVEAFRRSDGSRLWEYRVKATGEFPDLHEKHNLATPTPIVDGERIYAWFGNGQIVALDLDGRAVWTPAPGPGDLAVPQPLGTRQFAGALRRHADSAVRPPAALLPAGAGPAHGQAALAGRSRAGPHLAQHPAGGPRAEWRRVDRQLERTHRRLRPGHRQAALVRRQRAPDAHPDRRLPGRRNLLEPRLPQQRLHWPSASAGKAM